MTREELFKFKMPWPEMMAEAIRESGSSLDDVEIEDAFGVYSTGFFVFKDIHENCYHLWQIAPGSYPEYVSNE